jgi:hypothetical protein
MADDSGDRGYCIWLWDCNKWILIQNHCKEGGVCFDPNKGPLEIRGRRPCQMYQFDCSRTSGTFGGYIDYGYTICQYDGTQWVPVQNNCTNGGVENCGAYGGTVGDLHSFPCKPPGRAGSEAAAEGRADASDLALVLRSWNSLPSAVRDGILALIRSGG